MSLDFLDEARAGGDPGLLCAAVPMARFLGIVAELDGDDVICRMPFTKRLIGNPAVPALHGGGVGTLLETAAMAQVLWTAEHQALPKTITITVDYLRPALPKDTLAKSRIIRLGRRVATVQAEAWQGDKLVAVAKLQMLIERAAT